MKTFGYYCDMGSMKILFENSGSCFFSNDIGDIEARVYIFKDEVELRKKRKIALKFVGHFTSFGTAYLMRYDCDNEGKIYNFKQGRYFVELDDKGNFYIWKEDEDTHA